jgi:hypothetical protein
VTSKVTTMLCVASLLCGCATQVLTSGRVEVRDEQATSEVVLSSRDRTRIQDYYRHHPAPKASPTAARGDAPPPGLKRHSELPPGLQGRLLPRELETRLTVLPPGYVRLLIGRDVVLIERDTRRVFDILYDAVPD